MKQIRPKILILRFSSFGDVTQCLSVATRLSEMGEVHWATRFDLAPLLAGHPHIHTVWRLERREGLKGLVKLIWNLRKANFTHVYDVHNSLRSRLITWALHPLTNPTAWFQRVHFLRRPTKRWKRFLLFRFHIDTYQKPASGQRDLLEPLEKWGLSTELPPTPQIFPSELNFEIVEKELGRNHFNQFIALCPSAAHPLKRWPIEHWKKLIELLPEEKFVLLGGLHDRFVADLVTIDPNRIVNFAGRLTLMESAALLSRAEIVISNDTGPLHVAEQLGRPTIALMGPAPFGFPSRPSTTIMGLPLPCRPCSKHGQGPCVNPKYHQCLIDILPEQVVAAMQARRKA